MNFARAIFVTISQIKMSEFEDKKEGIDYNIRQDPFSYIHSTFLKRKIWTLDERWEIVKLYVGIMRKINFTMLQRVFQPCPNKKNKKLSAFWGGIIKGECWLMRTACHLRLRQKVKAMTFQRNWLTVYLHSVSFYRLRLKLRLLNVHLTSITFKWLVNSTTKQVQTCY